MIHIAICDDELQICNNLEQYVNELKEKGRLKSTIFSRERRLTKS